MIQACPTGTVAASADAVWSFLNDPRRLDLWWDAKVVRTDPEGPMAAGQRIDAETRGFGRTFHVWFEVLEVDPQKRRLRILAHLPLGLVDDATLTATPLDDQSCRLSFG